MKKIIPVILFVFLCLVVAFIFPQSGTSHIMVDDTGTSGTGCLECHPVEFGSTDEEEQHVLHSSLDCGTCHDGAPAAGNVAASACTSCHPFGDAGKCPLASAHDPGKGTTCLTCHFDCEGNGGPTTTTTIATKPCIAEKLYGEYSEEAELLRDYRDNVLSKTMEGQKLISLYYKLSPSIVVAVENNERFKEIVKQRIDEVLPFIRAEVAME